MTKTTYTVKEVARLLNFSTNTVYKHVNEGGIKAVRMGGDGRFRIPASEVERLLQERGISAVPQLQNTNISGAVLSTGDMTSGSAPSLFDWLMGFLSIGIGFAQFVNPVYAAGNPSLGKFIPFISVISVLLFLGGIFLLSFDLFKNKEKRRYKFLYLFIGILYLALSAIFLSQSSVYTIGYLSISLVMLISAFKRMDYYRQYIVYVNILTILIGAGFLMDPKSYSFSGFVPVDSVSKGVFSLVWLVFCVLFLFCSVKSLKLNKHYVRGISFFVGVMALLYSVATFVSGMWGRSIYGMILGTFSFVFPFAGQFDYYRARSKKEAAASLFWLLAVFLIGSVALRGIYSSFQKTVLADMEKKAEAAAEITKDYMDGNVSVLSAFLEDNELPGLMSGGNLTEGLDNEIRQIFLSSNNSFLRIVVTDNKGKIIDTYPFYLQSQNVDISDRGYFANPKTVGRMFITGFIQPNSPGILPSILISLPVKDENGKFLGVIVGSVDISELQKRLEKLDSGQATTILLADQDGNYILSPDLQKTIIKVPEGSLITKAIAGESGALTAYDEKGISNFEAYRKVDAYGWGILVTQPQLKVAATYNTMGFVAFLFFVIATIGSATLVMFLGKNK